MSALDDELALFKGWAGAPRKVRLGCTLVSHDRLGFCSACVPERNDRKPSGLQLEVACWRLLALKDAP